MARPTKDDPESYKGPREIIITKNKCGFCATEDHHKCSHEIPWFEKLWICPCECNKNWVPVDVGDASMGPKPKTKKEKKENANEVRDVQLPTETGQHDDVDETYGDLREAGDSDSEDGLEERGTDGDDESSEEREDL